MASDSLRILSILAAGLSALACSSDSAKVAAGDEGGACYRNGTCNGDWVCLSGLCVEGDPQNSSGGDKPGGMGGEHASGGSSASGGKNGSGGDDDASPTGGRLNASGGAEPSGGASSGGSGGAPSSGGSSSGGSANTGGSPGSGGSPGTNLIKNNIFANDAAGWTSSPNTNSIRTSNAAGSYCIYNPNSAVESVHFQYPDNISDWFPLKMGFQYQLSFEAVGFAEGTISIDDHEFEFSIADGTQYAAITEDFINYTFVNGTPVVFRFDIPAMDELYEYGVCFHFVNLWEK